MEKIMKYSFGDIFEVKTSKGLSYFQYVNKYNKPPYYGDLIRILDGYFKIRPKDFTSISIKKELFYGFVPLNYKSQRKYYEKVGEAKVPEEFKIIPPFRMAGLNRDIKTKIVGDWWLWENGKENHIGPINERLKKLTNLGTMNLKAIVNIFDRGYTPEQDVDLLGIKRGISIEDY